MARDANSSVSKVCYHGNYNVSEVFNHSNCSVTKVCNHGNSSASKVYYCGNYSVTKVCNHSNGSVPKLRYVTMVIIIVYYSVYCILYSV